MTTKTKIKDRELKGDVVCLGYKGLSYTFRSQSAGRPAPLTMPTGCVHYSYEEVSGAFVKVACPKPAEISTNGFLCAEHQGMLRRQIRPVQANPDTELITYILGRDRRAMEVAGVDVLVIGAKRQMKFLR